MNDYESLEDMYENEIEVSKEDLIKQEFDRIKTTFREFEGEIEPKIKESVPKKLLCIYLGAAVQNLAGKRDTDVLGNEYIYSKINKKEEDIRANISNLKDKKYLKKENRGKYKIFYPKMPEILDYLLKSE